MYNKLLLNFHDYGNYFLHNTIINDLPEFFKWYDLRFEPQNSIITLDYPILQDLSQHTGIHRIYEYIKCIALEQTFLGRFPNEFVHQALAEYNPSYRNSPENLCEILLLSLAQRSSNTNYTDNSNLRIEVDFYCQNLYNIIQQKWPNNQKGQADNE